MHQRPEAAVARGAIDVAELGIPIVFELVDEPEAEPDRIGKIDAGHTTRVGGTIPDAIRRKANARSGKPWVRQQPGSRLTRIAALSGG